MGKDSIARRIVSAIRKITGGSNTEFGEENRLPRQAEATRQPQQDGTLDSQQPAQDVYSKQEKMEEKE